MQSDTDLEQPQSRQNESQNQSPSEDFDEIARAIARLAGEPAPNDAQGNEQATQADNVAWAVDEMLSDNPPPEYSVAGRTMLDVLVLEALEPLLRDWLDKHLQPVLEKTLQDELKTRQLSAKLTVTETN